MRSAVRRKSRCPRLLGQGSVRAQPSCKTDSMLCRSSTTLFALDRSHAKVPGAPKVFDDGNIEMIVPRGQRHPLQALRLSEPVG